MTKIEKFVIIISSIPFGVSNLIWRFLMKNVEFTQEEFIFENAVKSARGDEENAREKLSKKIIRLAKIIRNRFNPSKLEESELINLQKVDTTGGFGADEEIIFLTNTNNCFGVNSCGEIYSFSVKSGNKYGFRRLDLNEILNLPKKEIGYLHHEFYQAAKEVFKNRLC